MGEDDIVIDSRNLHRVVTELLRVASDHFDASRPHVAGIAERKSIVEHVERYLMYRGPIFGKSLWDSTDVNIDPRKLHRDRESVRITNDASR